MSENNFPTLHDGDNPVPASLKRLRTVLAGFFILTILSSVYGGWWYYVASQFESGLDLWVEQRRQQGFEITYKQKSANGFPGTVKLELMSPMIRKPGDRGWTWMTEKLALSIKPWAFDRLLFDVKGGHQWQVVQHGKERRIEGVAKKWSGQITLVNGASDALSMSLSGLVVRDLLANDAVEIADAQMTLHDLLGKEPAFKVRMRDVALPKTLRAPLGDQVRHFDAKGKITGPVWLGKWPDMLVRWRDGGGTLDFDSFDLDYPPLRLRGDGTLALDHAMQPEAAFSVKAEGAIATVDALHNQGMIPTGTSFATKIALGVLSKPSENGGNSSLDLPITVQDQTLYVGSIKLLKFASVRW